MPLIHILSLLFQPSRILMILAQIISFSTSLLRSKTFLMILLMFQHLEADLDKKRAELRELLLLSTSKSSQNSSESTSTLQLQTNGPSASTSTSNSTSSTTTNANNNNNNNNNSNGREDSSPLNLSAESGIDNQERTSSVDSLFSKV